MGPREQREKRERGLGRMSAQSLDKGSYYNLGHLHLESRLKRRTKMVMHIQQ